MRKNTFTNKYGETPKELSISRGRRSFKKLKAFSRFKEVVVCIYIYTIDLFI